MNNKHFRKEKVSWLLGVGSFPGIDFICYLFRLGFSPPSERKQKGVESCCVKQLESISQVELSLGDREYPWESAAGKLNMKYN